MKIRLPKGFGGMSMNGADVPLKPDVDGCVDVEREELAAELIVHGGVDVAAEEAAEAAEKAARNKRK